ncbi:hypothetical protein SPI_06385 [Niveomyces insectorum RCEF 264]|uniref:Uncharacterized protein n=1 Tax=Niveomyces insectorum RCEF 264 TaxID=1081102 RepID=A0A167S338_9HYPO|nr:hypothetical protein SPI_06385 [Niveomyces insectorum RCEF 264]
MSRPAPDSNGSQVVAYDPRDRPLAATMFFEWQSQDGDRFFARPAVLNSKADAASVYGTVNQAYFYRAMTRDEAEAWLALSAEPATARVAKYRELTALHIQGHQGWASHREYAKKYLKRRAGYTHLLQVYAPRFLPEIFAFGYLSGKAESDEMSWGVGRMPQNSWRASKENNKAVEERLAWLTEHDQLPLPPRTRKPTIEEKARAIMPYYFIQGIGQVQVVNLRSEFRG